MYMTYHYICTPIDYELKAKLDELKIKYNLMEASPYNFRSSIVFDLRDNVPKEKEFRLTLPQESIYEEDHSFSIIRGRQYLQEDWNSAEWLMIWPGSSCPWPGFHDDIDYYEEQCPIMWGDREYPQHVVQTTPVTLSREPRLKKNLTFYGAGFGAKELLCDMRLVELFRNSGLNGFAFQNVLIGKARKPSEKVYQLIATHKLPTDAFAIDHPEDSHICSGCGMPIFAYHFVDHNILFNAEYFDPQIDFWQTPPMFGCYPEKRLKGRSLKHGGIKDFVKWGRTTDCFSEIIVSQRAYQFLLAHKLTRRLVVIPLEKQ